jgi:uncharacterized protein YhhL (DUF1145 family)
MTNSAIQFGKGMTAILWLMVITALFGYVPPPFKQLILYFGGFVFVVHCFEVIMLMTRYRDKVDAPISDCLNVLIYGVFSLQPLINKPTAESK